ncbi:hypothetical protein N9V13_04405 [Betaproteobacteria bacterium]|nr:hypothetical protein [Betaproteobacteria bacterium]
MSDSLELPKKGVKIYSPKEGWTHDQDSNLTSDASPTVNESTNLSTEKATDNSQDSKKFNSVTGSPSDNIKPLAVGDALEQLFETLNKTTSFSASSDMPTWKEVAELSRQMEEKLDLRKEVLEKLSLLDEDIQDTRKSLLKTLKALGKTENDKLSAATVRASVSAMAIDVLAKKLT